MNKKYICNIFVNSFNVFLTDKGMKIFALLSVILLVSIYNNFLHAQTWLWSNQVSGIENIASEAIGVDSSNNVYTLIELFGSVTISGNTKTSFGNKDLLLVKFNKDGIYQWAKVAGNVLIDDPKDLFVDQAGNSYLTGSFEGDAKFDNDSISAYSSKDAFVAKYLPTGGLDWVINAGWGTNVQKGIDLTVDANGYISLIGQFKDSVIFGDSIGAANCDTLVTNGKKNYFYAKFDNTGKYVSSSAKHFIATNNSIVLTSIDVCSTNEYYITGHFVDTVFFDTGASQDTLVSNGGSDIAVYKIDNSGNLVWSKNYGDINNDYCWGMAIDENDNGYITGYYSGSLTMDSFTINSNSGGVDIYTAKFENVNGDTQWLLGKGNSGTDFGEGISVRNNMVQIAGSFTDTLFWNNDTLVSSSTTNQEAFFAVYDYSGNEMKAESIGTATFEALDKAQDIVIDYYSNTYLAGLFKSDTIFIGTDTLENAFSGNSDVFIAKYGCEEITFNYILDTVSCSGGNNGGIIIQPSITNNFSYLWSTGDTNDTIINISEGWHTVTVSNSYGCTYIDSVEMISMPPLQTVMDADNITLNCIADNNGVGIVTPINGVGPFSYAWSSSLSTDSTASDLTVGTHYVTVTDACGSVTDTITVDYMPTLYTTMSSHSIIVLCETSTDGEATVTANDGVAPFTYQWSTDVNDTLAINNNLPIGMHYVTVTDICNVPTVDSVRVNYFPTMNASITESEPASCYNTADGDAYMFATSGVPPYSFLWDNGDTLSTTTALDTGWHYVTVTDFCISITDSVFIESLPPMTIDISSYQDVTCSGNNDGEAEVTVIDGVAPYFYSWSGTTNTNPSVNDLSVGWQYVTVTDFCGTLIDSVFIGTMSGLNLSVAQQSPASCSNTNDGSAIIYTQYGVSPFTFQWSGSASTDTIAGDLTAGWQYVTVTDACGSIIDSVEITYITPLSVSTSVSDLKCYGDTLGEIVLIPEFGVAPYTYMWSSISDTDSVAVNLPNGTYYFTVTDVCGAVSDSVIISSPSAISASTIITNESFAGVADGYVDLIVSGGTPYYLYSWSNGSTAEDLQNVTEGTYYFTITDVNECTLTDSVTIASDKKYIEIRNALTPNGDGKNDTWVIKYIESYPDCQVDVFNAWGINVFSSKGYTEPWNGKKENTGKDLPAATYYYIIDLKDGSKIYTGSVSIIK